MLVTVAICTWNRAGLLDQTLSRMVELRVPPGVDWELLVVDNNSTDDTQAVLARHTAAGRLPLRPLFEEKQGHCNARNCAVRHARGELILWTDDDVRVGPDWLAAYCAAAREYPDAGYFGGPIRPWFPSPPPGWMGYLLDTNQAAMWAILDYGLPTGWLPADRYVFGANMGYRAEVQRRYPFDPALGHVGGVPRGEDETAVQRRLWGDGVRGVWVAPAVVDHYVPAERMSLAYAWQRQSWVARMSHDPATLAGGRTWFGVPRWVWKAYVGSLIGAGATRLFGPARWMPRYLRAAHFRGVIAAARAHRAGRAPGG